MKQWILVVMAMGLSSQAWAQATCEDLFHLRGVALTTTEYSLPQQADPALLNSLTLNILQMTSFSKSSVFNEKNVVEKGELVLAKPLSNGWSMEFEYAADYRGKSPVFRLKEIDLIKPNGEVTTLDKVPNTTEGDALKKDFYTFEGMDASLTDAKISMPQAIHSPLFERIARWATLAEYIKRNEVQALKNDADLKTMRGKVFVRSTIDYTNKVIKKQSFKFLLLGMAMYLYAQKDKITNEVVLVDPWDEFKRQSDLALADSQMRLLMQTQVQKLTGADFKIPESYARESFHYFSFTETLEKIDILNRLERTAGSKMKVAWLHEGQFVGLLAAKDLHMDFLDTLDETDAVVLYFPKTERMLVLSGGWMKFERQSDLIVPYALSWNGGIDGNIYNNLKEKIKTLKKEF